VTQPEVALLHLLTKKPHLVIGERASTTATSSCAS